MDSRRIVPAAAADADRGDGGASRTADGGFVLTVPRLARGCEAEGTETGRVALASVAIPPEARDVAAVTNKLVTGEGVWVGTDPLVEGPDETSPAVVRKTW